MQRDTLLAQHVAAEVERLGGKVLAVDGSRPVHALAEDIQRHFGLLQTACASSKGTAQPIRIYSNWRIVSCAYQRCR